MALFDVLRFYGDLFEDMVRILFEPARAAHRFATALHMGVLRRPYHISWLTPRVFGDKYVQHLESLAFWGAGVQGAEMCCILHYCNL